MGFEGFAGEKEKKKVKEDAESREREQALDRARFGHEKNRLREEADRRREMLRLKEMVERGELAPEAVRAAARDAGSDDAPDVARILEVADALEKAALSPSADRLLPAALRMGAQEFRRAMAEPALRPAAIAKAQAALGHLHDLHWGGPGNPLTELTGVLVAAGKSLAALQESHVDAKNALSRKAA